jgi:hypothetical protein
VLLDLIKGIEKHGGTLTKAGLIKGAETLCRNYIPTARLPFWVFPMLERIQNAVERENPRGCCCCSHSAKHGNVTGKDDLRTAKGERGCDGNDDAHTQRSSADPPAYHDRPAVDEYERRNPAPNVDSHKVSRFYPKTRSVSHLICSLS